jgi:hypothetical protein
MAPKARHPPAAVPALPAPPVDGNRNGERQAEKTEHKRFALQLKKRPLPEQQTYANLPLAKKQAFREKWTAEENWDFVAEFKSKSDLEREKVSVANNEKTFHELKRSLGLKGLAANAQPNTIKHKASEPNALGQNPAEQDNKHRTPNKTHPNKTRPDKSNEGQIEQKANQQNATTQHQ